MRHVSHHHLLAIPVLAAACTVGITHEDEPARDGDRIDRRSEHESRLQRPPVSYRPDGTVETGGQVFATVVDFQHSADFVAHGRRCGTREPSRLLRGAPGDCTTSGTAIKPEYAAASGQTLTIPVVFHVIAKTDGTGDIPEALIKSQMEILNEDFSALAGTPGAMGTAAKIRFVLATKDPNGQPHTGINRVTNDNYFNDGGGFQMALHWDTKRYLNIYTNSAGGALGYATLASESAGAVDDGVVLLYTTVGRNAPQGGDYDQGRTATHEVGHYLGLLHTFDGGCGTATAPYTSGDLIMDTAAHAQENYECTAASSGCTGGGNAPIDNYMNYTPDTCMTKFTPEQVNRMRCSIMNYRMALVMNGEGLGTPPVARFSATVEALTATFADESTDADGSIAARNWQFGDGTSSSEQGPTHTYAAPGTYTVTLEVTDNSGATHSYSADVTVMAAPACQGAQCPCTDCDQGEDNETSGGCAATGTSPAGWAVFLVGVLLACRRRRT